MVDQDYVGRMSDILSILRSVKNTGYVAEADDKPEQDAPEGEETPEPGSIDQPEVDRDIDDLMTTPREQGDPQISVETLADDLGLQDTAGFKAAFNSLRQGGMPSDPNQVDQLANAFSMLMSSDASTAQRVVNRLRAIYRKKLPSA